VPPGKWCKSTAFRQPLQAASLSRRTQRARSSKRAGGLIPRIALDQCRVPERYRTRANFAAPKAFWAMHFFGMEASPVQLRVGAPVFRSRASAQAGFIRPLRPGQHWGLRFFARVVQPAETRRRERRQCRCESCRGHHFGLQALK